MPWRILICCFWLRRTWQRWRLLVNRAWWWMRQTAEMVRWGPVSWSRRLLWGKNGYSDSRNDCWYFIFLLGRYYWRWSNIHTSRLGQNSSWCLMGLKNYITSLKKQNFEYFPLWWTTVYNYVSATFLMSEITISIVTRLKYWMTGEWGSNSWEVLFSTASTPSNVLPNVQWHIFL